MWGILGTFRRLRRPALFLMVASWDSQIQGMLMPGHRLVCAVGEEGDLFVASRFVPSYRSIRICLPESGLEGLALQVVSFTLTVSARSKPLVSSHTGSTIHHGGVQRCTAIRYRPTAGTATTTPPTLITRSLYTRVATISC